MSQHEPRVLVATGAIGPRVERVELLHVYDYHRSIGEWIGADDFGPRTIIVSTDGERWTECEVPEFFALAIGAAAVRFYRPWDEDGDDVDGAVWHGQGGAVHAGINPSRLVYIPVTG